MSHEDGLTPEERALFESHDECRGYTPATPVPEPDEAPAGPAGASPTAGPAESNDTQTDTP